MIDVNIDVIPLGKTKADCFCTYRVIQQKVSQNLIRENNTLVKCIVRHVLFHHGNFMLRIT